MCLNPIQIVNPTKYISLRYKDRYLLTVPCGHCAECQQRSSNEWFFRSYYEMLDSFEQNGFVIFLTLTYKDKSLPKMSDFQPLADSFPCFNSQHLRDFVKRLRVNLVRKYKVNFTYFISSEYGTSEYYSKAGKIRKATHRPHYHCLFFVKGEINPLEFSRLVSKYWIYGLTDGKPYKSNYYVLDNTFCKDNFARALRCCKYVSKYVQKSCQFQTEINKRVTVTMFKIAEKMPVGWLETVNAKRVQMAISRRCNQFHRQSTGFGSLALRDIDVDKVLEDNLLYLPDPQSVVSQIPLPLYYKRKLFYQLKMVDGNAMWFPTELGLKYLAARDAANIDLLRSKYQSIILSANLNFDADELANYSYLVRGRIIADKPSTLEQRITECNLYNYVTLSDYEHLGKRGLVTHFIGNNTIGYRDDLRRSIPIKDFIKRYVLENQELEQQLQQLYDYDRHKNDKKQSAYNRKQYLVNLYHYLLNLSL